MPQPLLHNQPLDIPDGLNARPELGALVGDIAGSWSAVEFQMEQLLGRMLREQSAAALVMYRSLSHHKAKRDALGRVGEETLKGDQRTTLDALLVEMKARANERNEIVHGLWAASSKIPQGVILADAKWLADAALGSRHNWLFGRESLEDIFHDFGNPRHMVYKEKDFRDMLRRIAHLRRNLSLLISTFDPPSAKFDLQRPQPQTKA